MAHHAQNLVIVHGIAERHHVFSRNAVGGKHLINAGRLVHAALHHVNPLHTRRSEHEIGLELARQDIRHVHLSAVA